MSERIWTAGLIVIGDEILSGRTHDKNIAQVASWLQVQGIRLAEVRVVRDEDGRRIPHNSGRKQLTQSEPRPFTTASSFAKERIASS